jgi:hypothetical protein
MDESPLFTRAYDLLRESLIQSAGAHQEILELGACNYNSEEITGLAGSRGRDRSGEFRKAGVAVEGAVFVEPSVAGETAATVRCSGMVVPVPKYISSGVWP